MPIPNPITITADIKTRVFAEEKTITANDSVVLIATITDGGVAFDLTNVTNATLAVTRLDRVTVPILGTIAGETIEFKLSREATKVSGSIKAVIQLYDANEDRVSTIKGMIVVEADPTGDTLILDVEDRTLIQEVLYDGPAVIESAQLATLGALEAADDVGVKIAETEVVKLAAETVKDETLIVKDETILVKDATQLVQNETLIVKNDTLLAKADAESATEYATTQGDYAKAEADRLVGTDVSVLDNRLTTFEGETTALLADKLSQGGVSVNDIDKNLGKLDQTYMTEEFLQQIAGTASVNAVPALESITTKQLTFKPIIGEQGKNIFDKSDIVSASYINSAGNLMAYATYFVSQFIKITTNTQYVISPTSGQTRVAFYDANKVFISHTTDGLSAFTTPANAVFIRISNANTLLDTTMVEVGTVATAYESYIVKLKISTLPALSGEQLTDKTITVNKFKDIEYGKNLFNKELATRGSYIVWSTGNLGGNASYFASDFIPVDASTEYARSHANQMAFYKSDKTYISGISSTTVGNFTTPVNAAFVRVSGELSYIDTFQLEKGSISTPYESYGYTFNNLIVPPSSNVKPSPFLTFNDAWVAWLNGEKFPITFFGDSTIAGLGTTSYQDGSISGTETISINAFTSKLQTRLREATNNGVLKVYNSGHSGRTAAWATTIMSNVFTGNAYKDSKMVGIGFGINDRGASTSTSPKDYRTKFKANIKQIIEYLYSIGMQPFLMTTQAIVEAGTNTPTQPMRTGMHIETISNEVKRELAKEYGLELFEVNEFTERYLKLSSAPLPTIIPDKLHFGDLGHTFEAGLLFNFINPQTIYVEGLQVIDYASQKIISSISFENITMKVESSLYFKTQANYTKADAIDTQLLKAYVFVDKKRELTLKAEKNLVDSLTYVKVDGITTVLSALETTLSSLPIGLHTLEAWSGASDKVDFNGFVIGA